MLRNLSGKELGFTGYIFDVSCLGKTHFSVRCKFLVYTVQPNLRDYSAAFLKLTPMGQFYIALVQKEAVFVHEYDFGERNFMFLFYNLFVRYVIKYATFYPIIYVTYHKPVLLTAEYR